MKTDQISAFYVARPDDDRCDYWAKVIRAGQVIPLPEHVKRESDVPGEPLQIGERVELFHGDFLIQGQKNRLTAARNWAWSVNLGTIGPAYEGPDHRIHWLPYGRATRDAVRKAGRSELLSGRSRLADAVREIWARREGL